MLSNEFSINLAEYEERKLPGKFVTNMVVDIEQAFVLTYDTTNQSVTFKLQNELINQFAIEGQPPTRVGLTQTATSMR